MKIIFAIYCIYVFPFASQGGIVILHTRSQASLTSGKTKVSMSA